ncbi:MAG: class I SAM-dependent methyltransferase, partial [Myxococcota bacterium]
LLARSHEAWGLEPSASMRKVALCRHPELAGRIQPGALPDEIPDPEALGGRFDGILCSAVLQHLPRAALFDAVIAIESLLKPHGHVLVSVPSARPDIGPEHRDPKGRLFTPICADELRLLFERAGFTNLGSWSDDDAAGRPAHRWATQLFERAACTTN